MSKNTETPVIRALERQFYDEQKVKKASATLKSYQYHVDPFVSFLQKNEIEADEITPKVVLSYREEYFDDHRALTIRGQLNSIKVFLRFLSKTTDLNTDIPELIDIPDKPNSQRGDVVEREKMERILDHLNKYKYASRRHVLVRLMWDSGCRTGGIRSLDIIDFVTDRETITLKHTPSEDTPLKTKENGERIVSLRPETADLIVDYISQNRIDQTDEYGREPLITTGHGRPSRSWYREEVYAVTRPCMTRECPYDEEEDECGANIRKNEASQCSGTTGPHSIRRGRITDLLRNDIPPEMISDRSDVGLDVIDENYDARSEDEKLEQRRRFIDDL